MKGKVAQEIGFKTFIQLLSHSNTDIQKGAAVALGHYAGQEEYQQVFLLSYYRIVVLFSLAFPFYNFSLEIYVFKALFDLGVEAEMEPLFKSSDASTQHGCAMSVSNLSQNRK